jgi:basic membrane protein A
MSAAAEELGAKPLVSASRSDDDYAPNVASLVDQNCDIVFGVGFAMADTIKAAAQKNPDVDFAIVDDDSITLPNVKSLTFDAAQGAFLAGYAAASYSKTGVVGTFGGMQIPPVTGFMDGFAHGVAYYAEQTGKPVRLVGWDADAQTGTFTGGFESNDTAKNAAQGLIDQDADVIFPVGGPIFIAAAQAAKDAGGVALVGTDLDIAQADSEYASLFLTSVVKAVDVASAEVVRQSEAGKFSDEPFVGTLANKSIQLAPFHEFASKVAPGLEGELAKISAGIVDGSITP